MSDQDQIKPYNRLVAKAWSDQEFKARLLGEPEATLRGEGADVPDGMTVRILEPSETHAFLTLPSEAFTIEGADAWSELSRRALSDAAFKTRLLAEPVAVLAEAGIEAPADVQLEVVAVSDTQGYLVLPSTPDALDPEAGEDDVVGYFSCSVAVTPQRQPGLIPPPNMMGPNYHLGFLAGFTRPTSPSGGIYLH